MGSVISVSRYSRAPIWCDLVLKPARERSGRKRWALIWDNVKAHEVDSVRAIFDGAGITLLDLPKYTTDREY